MEILDQYVIICKNKNNVVSLMNINKLQNMEQEKNINDKCETLY